MSIEELKALQAFDRQVASAMVSYSVGNIILNIFLSVGFKYLWNMVTLVQFVIFMRKWKTNLAAYADIFLKRLKALAFFEFLPTHIVTDFL